MRPVDKGNSPYSRIGHYDDAKPYLEKRIGMYCSYCEMRVNSCLAVEHKESKNSGGALTDWSNLLLGCTYCNSRKSEKVKKGELDKWLWPDKHNTFLAFTYESAVPVLNESYLKSVGEGVFDRANQMLEDLGLDSYPGKTGYSRKDKRWEERLLNLGLAEEARSSFLKQKTESDKSLLIDSIKKQAMMGGFFSVWMMVFQDVPEVKRALIDIFPGTAESCFDKNGDAVNRPGEIL